MANNNSYLLCHAWHVCRFQLFMRKYTNMDSAAFAHRECRSMWNVSAVSLAMRPFRWALGTYSYVRLSVSAETSSKESLKFLSSLDTEDSWSSSVVRPAKSWMLTFNWLVTAAVTQNSVREGREHKRSCYTEHKDKPSPRKSPGGVLVSGKPGFRKGGKFGHKCRLYNRLQILSHTRSDI